MHRLTVLWTTAAKQFSDLQVIQYTQHCDLYTNFFITNPVNSLEWLQLFVLELYLRLLDICLVSYTSNRFIQRYTYSLLFLRGKRMSVGTNLTSSSKCVILKVCNMIFQSYLHCVYFLRTINIP